MSDSITHERYCIAKGLFHLATQHRIEADKYAKELRKALGADPDDIGSHMDDEIFGNYAPGDFDAALKRMDIEVEEAKP